MSTAHGMSPRAEDARSSPAGAGPYAAQNCGLGVPRGARNVRGAAIRGRALHTRSVARRNSSCLTLSVTVDHNRSRKQGKHTNS